MMGKKNKHTRSVSVTLNSVNRGEWVDIVWKPFFKSEIYINFAALSYKWSNGSINNAAVNIVEFLMYSTEPYINEYLNKSPNLWVEMINKLICDVL
jgi:hypothetical protein